MQRDKRGRFVKKANTGMSFTNTSGVGHTTPGFNTTFGPNHTFLTPADMNLTLEDPAQREKDLQWHNALSAGTDWGSAWAPKKIRYNRDERGLYVDEFGREVNMADLAGGKNYMYELDPSLKVGLLAIPGYDPASMYDPAGMHDTEGTPKDEIVKKSAGINTFDKKERNFKNFPLFDITV